MSRGVQTIDAHSTLDRAADLMRRHGIHHLVVVEGRAIVGIVTAEGVRWGEAEGIARVEDVMNRRIVSGTPRLSVRQAARLLQERCAGAIVVCEGSRLVGIVTTKDLVDLLAQEGENGGDGDSRRGRLRTERSSQAEQRR